MIRTDTCWPRRYARVMIYKLIRFPIGGILVPGKGTLQVIFEGALGGSCGALAEEQGYWKQKREMTRYSLGMRVSPQIGSKVSRMGLWGGIDRTIGPVKKMRRRWRRAKAHWWFQGNSITPREVFMSTWKEASGIRQLWLGNWTWPIFRITGILTLRCTWRLSGIRWKHTRRIFSLRRSEFFLACGVKISLKLLWGTLTKNQQMQCWKPKGKTQKPVGRTASNGSWLRTGRQNVQRTNHRIISGWVLELKSRVPLLTDSLRKWNEISRRLNRSRRTRGPKWLRSKTNSWSRLEVTWWTLSSKIARQSQNPISTRRRADLIW